MKTLCKQREECSLTLGLKKKKNLTGNVDAEWNTKWNVKERDRKAAKRDYHKKSAL